MSFVEIESIYTYVNEIETSFPIEQFSCDVSMSFAHRCDEIDDVTCNIINSSGGEIEFNSLGDILGFSVYDNHQNIKYKDQAEVEILEHLLQEREKFHLLDIINENGSGIKKILLTDWGRYAITSGIKYEYCNAKFTGFAVREFSGLPLQVIIDTFELSPDLSGKNIVSAEDTIPTCFLNKDIFSCIQGLCNSSPTYKSVNFFLY